MRRPVLGSRNGHGEELIGENKNCRVITWVHVAASLDAQGRSKLLLCLTRTVPKGTHQIPTRRSKVSEEE